MNTIESQIEALTQELRPYPETKGEWFWYFSTSDDVSFVDSCLEDESEYARRVWRDSEFCSFNKAEVEEYADCYKRLKLYQLLAQKAEKLLPNVIKKYATDFGAYMDLELSKKHQGQIRVWPGENKCCLGGVRFAMEKDRLAALEACDITKEFQEKCAKYGLGGA